MCREMVPQKTEAARRYSLCDNGLSVKYIGFVWRFLRPPCTGCVLSCRCGISPAAMFPSKFALAVATLRFGKVCIRDNLIASILSFLEHAGRATAPPAALPSPASARGPESLRGLSKSERGIRTSLSYDRISRLCHRSRSGLSGLGPETHDPLGRAGSQRTSFASLSSATGPGDAGRSRTPLSG